MKEQEIDNHQLAIRYFEGRITPSEEEILFRFVNDAPSNKRMFRQWEEEWMLSYKLIPEVSNEWKQLQRRMQVRQSLNGVFSTKHMQLQRFIAVAAIACVLLLSGTYGFYLYRNTETADNRFALETAYGEKSKLILADGTIVWLNAGSSLQYAGNFNSKNREVFLTGEAYFEVAKDKKPFIVKTSKYDVEVLGTTFNVEAYKDKPNFRTMLYEGKVKLYNTKNPKAVYLSPGQTAELMGESLRVVPTTAPNSYRWKDGLIYIEDKSFNAIMELFEKFYDVRIIVNNKAVKDLGYRGKLRISDGVDHALRVLQNDFPFKYKRDEERNIIYIN